MERWRLDGYRAVVTGSTKGIGHAIANEMLALGAEVLITSRTSKDVDSVLLGMAAHGGRAHGVACDVSTAEGRAALVEKVSALWGGELDGLVNNVGMNARKPIHEATDDDYRNIMSTNLDSSWYLCKLLKPSLQRSRRASVVNVASVAGVLSTGTGSVYAMTKAAMAQLSRSLACEWGPLGIRVNCVCPWMTMTPLLEDAVKANPSQLDEVRRQTPLGRLGEPEDTAGLVAFLCLPAAAFITGQVICADGGLCSQGFRGPCVQEAASL
eukprot:CAMPEP_0179364964 /NCGR_PEP_ID=MMETSP0797-20121207/82309_1 /TAXON_ID=47934 /ORGANISM="Dinophysis acuminata, Strain DAEP01" /LENGTH=267 /DNA_ID=CAMNT_0021080457 /DNA_START=29 /DNA_END=832 /DNA_ORIENTATION=+